MKITICEDNDKDLEMIALLCHSILDSMNVIAEISLFTSGEDLIKNENNTDLLILDIEMPGINGIEIKEQFQQWNKNTMILFVTEHDELMQSAFGIHVFGFIQKKNLNAHMKEILPKAVQILQSFVMINGEIDSREVAYIRSEHVYSKLYLKDGNEKLMRISLENLEKILLPVHFIRIHKSYLVNFIYIKRWQENKVMTDYGILPVSVRMRTKAKKQFDIFCKEHARY